MVGVEARIRRDGGRGRLLGLAASGLVATVMACGESEQTPSHAGESGSSFMTAGSGPSPAGASSGGAHATGGIGNETQSGAAGRAGTAGSAGSPFVCGTQFCAVQTQLCVHKVPATSGGGETFECGAFDAACMVHDCSCFCPGEPMACQMANDCACAVVNANVTITCHVAGPVP